LVEHPFTLVTSEVFKAISALGTGFTVSAGENILSHVHVLDLARLDLLLSSTLKAQQSNSQAEEILWGSEAYFFAASEEVSFAEFMTEMMRFLKEHEIVEMRRSNRLMSIRGLKQVVLRMRGRQQTHALCILLSVSGLTCGAFLACEKTWMGAQKTWSGGYT
jgi:hypothetical protein